MKERRCSVCSILESDEKPVVKLVEVGGKLYCENHSPLRTEPADPSVQLDPIATTPASKTDVDYLSEISLQLKRQGDLLGSIKGSLTFFVVIVVIAMFIQILTSCIGG